MYIKRCYVKGSAVIEMAYIMPVILFLFMIIINTVFYYHDKTIINGAAAETAIVAAQTVRKKAAGEYDMEQFFLERIREKLILMKDVSVSVEYLEKEVKVDVSAEKGIMRLHAQQDAQIVKPEEKIRWMN